MILSSLLITVAEVGVVVVLVALASLVPVSVPVSVPALVLVQPEDRSCSCASRVLMRRPHAADEAPYSLSS